MSTIVVFMILTGVIGTLVPLIPGLVLLWSAAVLHACTVPHSALGGSVLLGLSLVVLVGLGLDALCAYWGIKRLGGSWAGLVGAMIGGVAGFFIFCLTPIVSGVLGACLGAIVGECLRGASLVAASKAALGTILGGLLAFAVRVVLALCMAGFMLVRMVYYS
jgi:uncharacterized protein YqgC (DUF456 family)